MKGSGVFHSEAPAPYTFLLGRAALGVDAYTSLGHRLQAF
jgi:hypothetical protein